MRLRISTVSYLNSIPFVYGIEKSGILKDFILEKDVPSVCAKKLITGQVDIGIVPVAILNELKEYHILTDYCIGATGKVASVLLFSKKPIHEITEICLDTDSRTSVALIKILCKQHWKINPTWKEYTFNDNEKFPETMVAIGDKTFDLMNEFSYIYDLGEEWNKFSSLPFVFACWVSIKKISDEDLDSFNQAIAFGVTNKFKAVEELANTYNTDVNEYVEKYISYELDDAKRKGLKLFLDYLKKMDSTK